jgi:SagB-type dehydrogenase family enzyme
VIRDALLMAIVSTNMAQDPVSAAIAYHELSKHRLPNRYARSQGYLDWDTQPNPFRLYEGVDRVPLARDESSESPTLDALYDPARVPAAPVDASSVARLLFDSLALSAWKEFKGQRWSLRCNPSSGNLHPTEAHLVTAVFGGAPTVGHYTPLLHALEPRARLDPSVWSALLDDGDGVLVGLSSILWREAWKYGERAYRYCQHDVGHAIASLAYAGAALGWHTRMLPRFDDAAVAALLGLEKAEGPEAEHPDLLLFIGPRLPTREIEPPHDLALTFAGTPNQLSESHHPWPVTEHVARACVRAEPVVIAEPLPPSLPEPPASGASARHVVRTRRSAVDMDGVSTLAREAWLRMLARTLPRPGQVPFASLLGRPRVHLLLFVHRVDEVEPGLYLLLRDSSRREAVARSIHADFKWTQLATGELDLPLYLLEPADTRNAAALLSCRQAIAADGAFAVAMLAELEPSLREYGAWMYRHLHWEAGAIGQVLYLEAEAAQRRATGIGCFFDDAVAELLGVRDRSLASLYHFTVGGPVQDVRLQTLDAYHHLDTR